MPGRDEDVGWCFILVELLFRILVLALTPGTNRGTCVKYTAGEEYGGQKYTGEAGSALDFVRPNASFDALEAGGTVEGLFDFMGRLRGRPFAVRWFVLFNFA